MKIILGPGILQYPWLMRPKPGLDGGEAKYSCRLILDPTDPTVKAQLKELDEIVQTLAKEKFGARAKDLIAAGKLRMPVRQGSEFPDDPAYAGKVFVNASSKTQPGLIDGRKQDVIDPQEVYSGRIARIFAGAFAYDTAGNKGISLGLNDVQLGRHAPRIDGRKAAKDVFGEMPMDEDDIG